MLHKAVSLASDPEPVVRFQLALSLGSTDSERATEALADRIVGPPDQADKLAAPVT
jgi:hypothetical protein